MSNLNLHMTVQNEKTFIKQINLLLNLLSLILCIHFDHISKKTVCNFVVATIYLFPVSMIIGVKLFEVLKFTYVNKKNTRRSVSFIILMVFVIDFLPLTLIGVTTSVATENLDESKIQESYFKKLNTLEDQRDEAFRNRDIPAIEQLTRTISQELVSESSMPEENCSPLFLSILKTRHLFPGKIDLFSSFYSSENSLSSEMSRRLALIFVVDAIAQLSTEDINFYANTLKLLKEENLFSLERKIINKIYKNILNKRITENISIFLNNTYQISLICEMEYNFAPIITFNNLFNHMMADPYYRGYEVVGISEYTYWPSNAYHAGERINYQKYFSSNEYCGRFMPLSLVATQINSQAIEDFPILKNYTGSFFAYNASNFPGISNKQLFLISKNKSLVSYNNEHFKVIQDAYASLPVIESAETEVELRYYAEQGIVDAQSKYAEELLINNNPNLKSYILAFEYIKCSNYPQKLDAQYNLGRIHQKGVASQPNDKEAAKMYKLAAVRGHRRAQYILSMMYEYGRGVESNKQESSRLFNLATNKGNPLAQYKLALEFEHEKLELNFKQKFDSILNTGKEEVLLYALSANQGYVESQYNLAFLYLTGEEVTKDESRAAYWLGLASETGYCPALSTLGLMYISGLGVDKNENVAASKLFFAANQGCSRAQNAFGIMCLLGIGCIQNYEKAAEYFLLSTDQEEHYGDQDKAQNTLGIMYLLGAGVKQDYDKAREYFSLSANEGNGEGLYNSAVMYERGLGITPNSSEALKLYCLAADQGYFGQHYHDCATRDQNGSFAGRDEKIEAQKYSECAEKGDDKAQYTFGVMLLLGIGVEKNVQKAIEFFKLASDNGNDKAQCALGEMYYSGTIIEKNIRKATKFANLAVKQGNAEAHYWLYKIYESRTNYHFTKNKMEAARWHYASIELGYFAPEYDSYLIFQNKNSKRKR